jgi:hypothetical protein
MLRDPVDVEDLQQAPEEKTDPKTDAYIRALGRPRLWSAVHRLSYQVVDLDIGSTYTAHIEPWHLRQTLA